MSKKISIVISVILFIILMVLIVCEKMNPEAGTALIHSIFNDRGVLNEKKALRKGRKSKALQKVFFSSAGICGNLYCDSWCCNGFA